jgi:histidyl-tRNA synthetase
VVDLLCPACKTHFKEVLENLDNLQIPYNLNPRLVRGLDYYTRTVFEFYENTDTNRQNTLLAGGRYDNLVKLLGGQDTPAVGFAAGMERIIERLKERGIALDETASAEVSIIQIGQKAQKRCLALISQLEDRGISANCILGKESLKGQLRMASKMKVKFALIIGQREVLDKSVIVRNMDDSSQETIKLDKLIDNLKAKLGK